MAKYLDKVIEEMGKYSEMGLPDGEGSMGMGTPGHQQGGRVTDAYKLNSLLRRRNRAEQQEDTVDDMDAGIDSEMDTYKGDVDDKDGIEEIKTFFIDNPNPSDEDVMQYAEEHNMDMQQMRQAVYNLIQELLSYNDEEMDDYDASSSDSSDVSIDMDTGDKTEMANNEEREIRTRSGRTFRNRTR